MIHLDTSVLVDALTGARRSAGSFRRAIEDGERLGLSTLVLYEWFRGPRIEAELAVQEELFPLQHAVAFGVQEARLAAHLYRVVPGARRREFDLGVAACALTHGAALWTMNAKDFRDIPDLQLYAPARA